jgi:hypothetical protein
MRNFLQALNAGGESRMNDELVLVCPKSTNKRPQITEEMRRQAAEQIVAEMVTYDLLEGIDQADTVRDIVKATDYETDDGFKIARELERKCHWDCDMQIAEQLDQFGATLDMIYAAAEKVWAAENPKEPEFRDGDPVIWRGKPATVRCVHQYRPQCYEIRQGELGPNSAYIVPFEDVTAAPDGAA